MRSISRSRTFFAIAILFTAIISFTGSSCSILRRDKQSAAEKKQQEADKQASAEYEKARKQHYRNQSKEAKKMMKKTKKQADGFNKPKRRKGFNKTKCN